MNCTDLNLIFFSSEDLKEPTLPLVFLLPTSWHPLTLLSTDMHKSIYPKFTVFITLCYFLLEQSVIILVDVESAIASKIVRIHARIFVVVQCKVLVSDLFLCTGDDSLGQIRVFLSQLQDHTFHFVQRMFLVITGQLFGSWHLLCWWLELRFFGR